MVALHKKYHKSGLEILAFPCNQFGGQEPKPAPEVEKWAKETYGTEFQICEKIHVNGEKTHPVYQFLKKICPGDLTWNFSDKYIVSKEGVPCARFGSKKSWEMVEEGIKAALEQ